MPSHPSNRQYAEHWPTIGITLDYRGGLRYWGVIVEAGLVIPGEVEAFSAALADAETACDTLNEKIIGRIRDDASAERKVI